MANNRSRSKTALGGPSGGGSTSGTAPPRSASAEAKRRPKPSGPLEDELWYHGLMPREDISKMLVKKGDWLVRRSEVNNQAKHVLSIFWDGDDRHVVLHKTEKGNRYMLDKEKDFANIQDLVRFYSKKGQALPRVPYLMLHPVLKQDWELRHDWITLGKKLGEGAFGEVFMAELKCQNGEVTKCAVKRSLATKKLTKEEISEIVSESRIMQKYKHPNLVRLLGVAAEMQPIMLVLELVTGGGLDSYLQKNLTSTAWKIKFCLDAAKGTEYLHENGCLHRDLACRNCLLSAKKVVKISDFGLSQEGTTYTMKEHAKVPIRWLAPETIITRTYTLSTDVWSFGIMMWEILHNGSDPYPDMSPPEVASSLKAGYRMPLEDDPEVPTGARNIMNAAWASEPDTRPLLSDVRQRLDELHKLMPVEK